MNNKKAKLLVKIAAVTSTVFFGISLCATAISSENATAINNFLKVSPYKIYEPEDAPAQDTEYFTSKYENLASLISDGKKAAQDIEAEGAVLLKNDNCLPLSNETEQKKISLVGISSIDPAYGGSGSAQTGNPQPPVTPVEGFKQAGFDVNQTLIDFYSASTSAQYKRVGRGVDARINDAPWDKVIEGVGESGITSHGDAAIVTFSRVGGEGMDMARTEIRDGTDGDYLKLSPTEITVLKGLANLKSQGKIKKIIVLLNTANQIETEFIYNSEYGIDAALWIGHVGITGFNAVGDIIAGKVTPSGHLSDTFWLKHSYNPVTYNFGEYRYENASQFNLPMSGNNIDKKYTAYVTYQEGIYVGYRYTETRYYDYVTGRAKTGDFDYSKVVSHPFGSGESYAEFSYSGYNLTDNNDGTLTIDVTVTNTSASYSGKDVVQIYVQKPFDDYDIERGIEKSAVDLIGYAKTDELEANGGQQTVHITVDKKDFAVYDANDAKTYILTGGDYLIAAGSDAHDAVNNILAYRNYSNDKMDAAGNAAMVGKVTLSLDKTTYSVSEATGNEITNLFDHGDINKYFNSSENNVKYLSRTDWEGTFPTTNVTLKMTQKLRDDMVSQTTGKNIPKDNTEYPTYGKNSDLKLIDLRVDENGDTIPYDDEKWDALMDQLTWDETVELLNAGLQSTRSLPSIIKPATVEQNGPTGLTKAYGDNERGLAARKNDSDKNLTAPYYPCIGILGSTFNVDLADRFGDMLGEDAIWAGYAGFYGIGLNTHRSPYGGRLYEYFSEDGLLSGTMAAAEVKAIQSHGMNAYIKHFALNDQETQRAGVGVWLNEQSFREIYLKSFEIAVVDGGAMNAMAAFNRIGAFNCPADKALLTDFLRGELGMKGFVVSDMYGIGYKPEMMPIFMMAGCDLPDGELDSGAPYRAFKTGHGEVAWQMREAAKRILYATVHSTAMNGLSKYSIIEKIVPGWQVAVITLDCLFGAMFAASAAGAVVVILKDRKSKSN